MNSIHCPDCSTEVSSSDVTCPSCNFPVAKLMGFSSAILRKDPEMVAGLIQLGADVNAIDKNGRTPLMIAASIGSAEIVQMLLAAGAKLDYVNQAGETAVSVARSKEVEKLLRRAFVVSRFISLRKPEPKSSAAEEPEVPATVQTPTQEEPISLQAEPQIVEEPPAVAIPPEPTPEPAPKSDFDATQPIPLNNEIVQEVILGKSEPEAEVEIPSVDSNVEEVPVEPALQAATPEDVIEETLLISPFLIHEVVEEPKIEPMNEVVEEEVPQAAVETQQPEETFEMEKPIELELTAEEPSLDFDKHLGFTELSAWENRAPSNHQSIAETILENPQREEPSFIEQPEVEMKAEEPAVDFDEPLVGTDISAWENRVEYHPEEKIYEEQNVEEATVDEPQPEEVAVARELNEEELFNNIPQLREPFIEFSPDEFEAEQIAALSDTSDSEIANLHDEFIENMNEHPISFQLSEEEHAEIPETRHFDNSSVQFPTDMEPEDSSWNFNTAQQLRSKFQDYEEWFELHQSSQEDFLRQELSETQTNEPQQAVEPIQRERVPDVNCLECGEVIGPNELRCSKCHTTIVRRYCAGCSELIPDHAIFCPYCGTYVTEHFHIAKKTRERYVFGATVGLCILIILMVLTWPRTAKPKGYQATQNLKPVHQIVKTQRQKSSPIVFLPSEPVQEKKVEPLKQPKVQKTVPRPAETKMAANIKPAANKKQAAVIKQPPVKKEPVNAAPLKEKVKPVTTMASVNRSLSTSSSDDEKIELGRSLNSRGYSLINQGRPGEAIPLLEQSLRSFPKGTKDEHYAYALFNLGVAWRMAGRPDIAIPILEKRIKINNQREVVARELSTAKKQAQDAGFGSFQK